MDEFIKYLPVLAAALAGIGAALVTAFMSKDKVRADATKTLTDISLSLVEPQKRRIADLEKRITKLENENSALHTWAQHLVAQVVESGQEPIPFDSTFLPGRDK